MRILFFQYTHLVFYLPQGSGNVRLQYLVNRYVVRFARYVVELLEIKAHPQCGYAVSCKRLQKPVVVSLSPAEAVAVAVERHSRHHGKIYVHIVGESPALRLPNGECSAFQASFAAIFAQFQSGVSYNNGQQYPLAARMACHKTVGVRLVGQGVVEQYRLRRLENRVVFKPAHYVP